MLKYEIREICGDWAIYEVRETETEGGERCLLILNSRANAEYVKAILEHEARYPNAAVPYRPEVADMSDEEVVAVNRLCCSGGHQCHACPLSGSESVEETCFEVERRVNGLAEERLLYRELQEMTARYQTLEEMEEILASSKKKLKEEIAQDEARTPHPSPSATPSPQGEGLEACKWISVDERLPDESACYLVNIVNHFGLDFVIFTHYTKCYGWGVPDVTHWMPLPQPPMMKGGAE